jgi:hypothetical protein
MNNNWFCQKFDISHIYFLVIILVILIIIFIFIKLYYKRKLISESKWNILYKYASQQRLSHVEMKYFKEFFKSLNSDEHLKIILSKKYLHENLFTFLEKRQDITAYDRVKFIEKLFTDIKFEIGIKTLKDLHLGEKCALLIENQYFLCTILQKEYDKLFITSQDFFTTKLQESIKGSLYFYRPQIGGYLINGTIGNFFEENAYFTYDGSAIEKMGDQHIMAYIEFDVRLSLLPPPIEGDADAEIFKGITKKVSDRALLFKSEDNLAFSQEVKNKSLWKIEIYFSEVFKFVCKGKIYGSNNGDQYYIFRYLDISDNTKKLLLRVISHNKPLREKMS